MQPLLDAYHQLLADVANIQDRALVESRDAR